MPNQILQILLKSFRSRELLTKFESTALSYYGYVVTGQELNYYTKIVDKFYTNI